MIFKVQMLHMKMATKFQQGGRGSLDDKVEKENSEREKEGMCQESCDREYKRLRGKW